MRSENEVTQLSRKFIQELGVSLFGSVVWLILIAIRFMETYNSVPFVRVASEYRTDFDTAWCVVRASILRHCNRNRVLIFDSMESFHFVEANTLASVDVEGIRANFERFETFMSIYRLEMALAVSVIPNLELIERLDGVIARYKNQRGDIIQELRGIRTSLYRSHLRVFASGVLAFVTLILITPESESAHFWTIAPQVIGSVLVGLGILTLVVVWRSFEPLT